MFKNWKPPFGLVGMGLSGHAALKYLLALGYKRSQIFIFDDDSTKSDVQQPEDLLEKHRVQTLVVSPGYPLRQKWLEQARAQGVSVTSELNLAFHQITDEKIIGITGAVGKSTTTSLVGEVIHHVDKNAFVGGNLGFHLCNYAADLASGQRKKSEWIVLELSSFHLENCEQLRLDGGILISLYPNHLERYQNLDDYYSTKFNLFDHCQGPMVLNAESNDLLEKKSFLAKKYSQHKMIWSSLEIARREGLEKASLLGRHNQENLAAAWCLLHELGFAKKDLGPLLSFRGLPHRLENLGSKKGLTFVNDSKATTVESVLRACEALESSLSTGAKIHLLLGGKDKSHPWEQLTVLKKNPALHFYFFGASKDLIPKKSSLSGDSFPNLRGALDSSTKNSKSGDFILLAPGGTSFDEFKNFEERGNYFKEFFRNF